MDKSQIINEIKLHLNIKTDSELADFLGVKQPTISSWRKRDTLDYELIITKCNIFNAEWLITGKGNALKSVLKVEKLDRDVNSTISHLNELLELKQSKINNLEKEIELLKTQQNK